MYSSSLSITSALDGVGGHRNAPVALPLGKTLHPLCRRLGGTKGRSGRVRKISPPQGLDPWTVRPVASRYTDWAIPTHLTIILCSKVKLYLHRPGQIPVVSEDWGSLDRRYSWYSFLMINHENYIDPIGNRTPDLLSCNAVPQPTAPSIRLKIIIFPGG